MAEKANAPSIGQFIDGYEVPVINEKAVRLSAGILLSLGIIAISAAITTGSQQPLQPFGMFFLIDMLIRLIIGDTYSPTLAISRLILRKSSPNWVGAPQKRWAWTLGAGLAFTSCAGMGFLDAPLIMTLLGCSICLVFLFLEAGFGFCIGCKLHSRFSKENTRYCADGSCSIPQSEKSSHSNSSLLLAMKPSTSSEDRS